MHKAFVDRAVEAVKSDPSVMGLAVGGSWIEGQIDEFSDIDLVLITDRLVSDDFDKMYRYAERFGRVLNAFTGEHVGERRLLICMYDEPLIHVDIKFLVLEEVATRIEDPVVLWDKGGAVKHVLETTAPAPRRLDYQWIEDRFWTWIHYAALKLGRGEYFEALDCTSFLRSAVLSPLLQAKHGLPPRGLRKLELKLAKDELKELAETVPVYSALSIAGALEKCVIMYRALRGELFKSDVTVRSETEAKCLRYFYAIKESVTSGAPLN